MSSFYVHDLVAKRVLELKQLNKETEIIGLLEFFGQAQDLVNKVIPFFCPTAEEDDDNDDEIVIQVMRMEAREELLFKIMLPHLAGEMVLIIPLHSN